SQHMAPDLLFHPVLHEAEALAGMSRPEVIHPPAQHRVDQLDDSIDRLRLGRDRLDSLLLENDGKPARERLTLIRLFEDLRALGYEGGYDAVRRYARTWSREHASQ